MSTDLGPAAEDMQHAPIVDVGSVNKHKSVTVAVLLAALPGLLALFGMGHFYLRRFRRACLFLFGGWVLGGLAFMFAVFWSMSHMIIPPPGYPRMEPPAEAIYYMVASLVLGAGFVAVWVLQIFDARAVCRRQNAARDDQASSSDEAQLRETVG